jgi:SAM-dependent methyltransferase
MDNTGERMVPEYSDPDTFWEHIHRYSFAVRFVREKRVLDIASGEGYGCCGSLKAGAKSVIGVDIDPSSCAHAARKYKIDVRVGSAEAIPVETGSVDVVVSFETIEHVPNPGRFLDEVSRVLTADGLVIISTPNKNLYSPPGKEPNPYHCSEMAPEEFQDLLCSTFSKISLFGQRPHSAKWWSPISLTSETSPWDRMASVARLRRRLWSKWNPQRLTPVPEVKRQNPVDCILNGESSWLERTVNWSAVRPLRKSRGWSPVFLIAAARKRN